MKATLDILYSQQPDKPGEKFVELRRWRTPDGRHEELVLETGYVRHDDELQTTVKVLPFYLERDEALAFAGIGQAPVPFGEAVMVPA